MPNGQPLIDAYMGGRTRGGSVAGEVIRLPRKLPDNTPFVFIYSQTEALRDAKAGIPLPPDTDHPRVRYYEVADMSHLRLAGHGTLHKEYLARDVGKGGDPRCQHIYDEPVEVVASALLDGMDKWVRDGKSMPKGLRFFRSGKTSRGMRLRTITVDGTVSGFMWTNPHIFIALDVRGTNGKTIMYKIEGGSPNCSL